MMQSTSKNESDNNFVMQRLRRCHYGRFLVSENVFCHQKTLEVVDISVFILLSLVYPTTASYFSSIEHIDESLSLAIDQTREFFSH